MTATAMCSRLIARLPMLVHRRALQSSAILCQHPAASFANDENPLRLESSQAGNLMDIGIRPVFSSEHDIFRQQARRFFQDEAKPYHELWEEAGQCSREIWRKAGEQGLLAVSIPDDIGGVGGDFLSAAVVFEEMYYAQCTGLGFSVHSELCLPYIAKYGSTDQIKTFMPKLVSGEWIICVGMSEPAAGSDLQGIQTRAKKVSDNEWIVNGSKVFTTNGVLADVVLLVTRTNPNVKASHGISIFLVKTDRPGFTQGKALKKIGLHAQDTGQLFFDDLKVTRDDLLGEENQGFVYMMNLLPTERIAIAGWSLSHSEWMFEHTREFVKNRKAFGKTLSNLQTIQHKLAEMKTEICIARNFVDRAMLLHSTGQCDMGTACMAKLWCSDLQIRVADACVQMHGGMGYMLDSPIGRAFIDARPQAIYGGTNEIMKELIARPIVGRS